jgi:trehalose 6-phosphate synthase
MAPTGKARLLVASNRGPLSFREQDDGSLEASRGGGGLVSGLMSMGGGDDIIWVCAALSDGDRLAARRAPSGRLDLAGHDTDGTAVRMLDIDPATFHRAYNVVANSTLWFVHHLLFATPTAPAFDMSFRRAWASY